MVSELPHNSSYTGTKSFSQHNVQAANATGFGAATDDFMERGIDLNEKLVMNKPATYFFRMNGDAMEDIGIYCNDILIVDRSIKATHNRIIIAAIDGELIVRRFEQHFNRMKLVAENKKYKEILIEEFTQFLCWGVVTAAIHLIDKSLILFNANK